MPQIMRPRVLLLQRTFVIVAGTLFAAACATAPATPPPTDVEQVTWWNNSNGPFCGRCDTWWVTVAYDGRAWIEHGYWTGFYENWRTERTQRQLSAATTAQFRERLQPFRPSGELALINTPPCETLFTDHGEVTVTWSDAQGDDRLVYNFGCDREAHAEMADALRTAPMLLDISGFD